MSEQNEFEQLDCSAVIADVWLMLDNECDDRTRARLQRHMEDCGSCFEAYGIEAKVKSLLARKCGGEHAPDSLRQRLRIQLSQTTIITRVDPGL
ncbi:mycothiol system anti-sigma-R factor [Rhodococcus olei]|uniref:Mycothiol system anti-sigma-R factor n=1 Tax=Rhodococcus olei TaxID=2161675 RepID=A0ABP8NU12_9NOCA